MIFEGSIRTDSDDKLLIENGKISDGNLLLLEDEDFHLIDELKSYFKKDTYVSLKMLISPYKSVTYEEFLNDKYTTEYKGLIREENALNTLFKEQYFVGEKDIIANIRFPYKINEYEVFIMIEIDSREKKIERVINYD